MVITAVLALACGGVGAVARFALDSIVQLRRIGEFPLGTLVINVGGSFLLGLLVGLHVSGRASMLLASATLGSYTTFSTWMLETHRPAQDGEAALAWQNIGFSIVGGLAAVAAGRALGGLL